MAKGTSRKPMYWWNQEIAELRRKCLAARRKSTRSRGNEDMKREYSRSKNLLKQEIKRSKESHWKNLIAEVESDPWGLPYKIVAKKLRVREHVPQLNNEAWVRQIISDLFPKKPLLRHNLVESTETVPPPFTLEELDEERRKLKLGKAPGPDCIPNEVIKELLGEVPELWLQVYNKCLEEGVFPERWKRQRLVLLRKGDKSPDLTSSYRPICLLDTAGKILEGLLIQRINTHLKMGHQLSQNQYGFKKYFSTVDAIQETLKITKEARERGGKKKGFCALIALDIKNAFNSLRWGDIVDAMNKRQFPIYIEKLVRSYLNKREITYENKEWTIKEEMTCGAPQGSRLGPLFWNLVYDGFLQMKLTRGAKIIGFADDAILIVEAESEVQLELRMDENVQRVKSWLEAKELKMAVHKTEAILVTKRRKFRTPKLVIEGVTIEWKGHLTYLGVEIDKGLSFGPHINKIALKASRTVGNLARLMPNVGGAKQNKRKLLASVSTSQMLYAAPAWKEGVNKVGYLRRLKSVHRCAALRIISGYRTVADCSALVLAGTPPIDLLITERTEMHEELKNSTLEGSERQKKAASVRKEARERLLNRWQLKWEEEEKGRWTRRLIPDIKIWTNRSHGSMGFHLTQALTGHGAFRSYLYKVHKTESDTCLSCKDHRDDAEHTIFWCPKFTSDRKILETEMGGQVTIDNLITTMVDSELNWNKIESFIRNIMEAKAEELRS